MSFELDFRAREKTGVALDDMFHAVGDRSLRVIVVSTLRACSRRPDDSIGDGSISAFLDLVSDTVAMYSQPLGSLSVQF